MYSRMRALEDLLEYEICIRECMENDVCIEDLLENEICIRECFGECDVY